MLNTNNKVNYEINMKQKEKKYSWSAVFAWLYLKTIGRILPKKWNKWAENILYYDKATGSNEIRTDDPETTDESAQIDLKPEMAVKESQSEIVSEDEKVQTNKVTFQNTTMQTEYVETTDRNIEADLKPEVAVKESQSEIISKDGEVQTEENSEFTGKGCFYTIVNGELIDEDYDSMEEVSTEEDEELKKQLEDVSQELEDVSQELEDVSQALELEHSQNVFLKEEKRELQSIIEKLEKDYKKLAEDAGKREEELVVVKEKDMKINSLTWSNKALEQDKKEMEAEVEGLRKHLQSTQESKQQLEKEKIDLEGKLKDLNSQLSAAEVEKKSSENEVSKLRKQVQILEGSKEWELAGIDDSLKKVFLDVIGMLEKELLINNQEQQLQGKKVDLKDKLKILISQLNATKEEKQILEGNKAKEIERLKADLEKKLESSQGDNKKLQEQVEHLNAELERVRNVAILSIGECTKTLDENLTLKNQQIESSPAEDEQQNGKLTEKDTQEQTKAQGSSIVSLKPTSTKKSLNYSMKSTQSNVSKVFSKLLGDKNLNNFLSRKNEELKKSFPGFKGKHFCHNVLDETIKSLSNQDDGKFGSSKLLELLENNLKQSAREIIKAKVNTVVEKVGKKHSIEQVFFVEQCAKELYLGSKDSKAIICSFTDFLANRNNSNNDSVKNFVVQELTKAQMKCFLDKIQGLQLASSMRDKFLSPDQKMCNQTQGGVNEYQLTEKVKKEYTPHSSMSCANIASIHPSNCQQIVRASS